MPGCGGDEDQGSRGLQPFLHVRAASVMHVIRTRVQIACDDVDPVYSKVYAFM